MKSRWRAVLAAVLLAVAAGCGRTDSAASDNASPPANDAATERPVRAAREAAASPFALAPKATSIGVERPDSTPRFADVHREAGIDFVYETGAKGEFLMVETMGGGAGWLDFDADGACDLFLVQGGDPTAAAGAAGPRDRLYRNVGGGRFAEVAASAGTDGGGYGQGIAVGDYDGDGFDDVYVTNVGENVLYRNNGDGTFSDVTEAAGAGDPGWGTSAAWGDLDLDGDLDLFLCNYVAYDPRRPLRCSGADGSPRLCDPTKLDACPNECFVNRGDGGFAREGRSRGLDPDDGNGKSLGVVIADLNLDGRPDVYVANDTTANYWFVNRGGGVFDERAVEAGCATDGEGRYQASMGVAFGDYDRDGRPDLYLTHYAGDYNTLYRNLGEAGFVDVTGRVGLAAPTVPLLAFGTVMADFDRDGREDLFVADGHLVERESDRLGYEFAMRPQLFSYVGPRWVERRDEAGPYFSERRLGRGVAAGDYDDDGDLDLAVVNQGAPAALLRNEADRGRWLKVRLIGAGLNRRGVGARVTVRQGARSLTQQLAGGTSYCAAHEPALLFGLGDRADGCEVEVRWPGGQVQTVPDVAPDRTLVVRERGPQG